MNPNISRYLKITPELQEAVKNQQPIVALESTIIAHGLPYPENVRVATLLEQTIRDEGAIPATLALLDGLIHVGLEPEELESIASGKAVEKVSRRDFARVLATNTMGATTVSATLMVCQLMGIRVFATGGIGGVHRQVEKSWDISADLQEIARTDATVVAAGVKSILDIPKTLEALETLGVPVATYQADQVPAFYSRQSGIKSPRRLDEVKDLAREMALKWGLGIHGGFLLNCPIPEAHEIPMSTMEPLIEVAMTKAKEQGIEGKETTPFLLKELREQSAGLTLEANIKLAQNNSAIASKLAMAYSEEITNY